MSEIFISYKSERKQAAEHFAEVLRRYGYSVWFDYSLVKGKDFAEQIDRQIRQANAVVVLWCAMSVTSRWVKEEAYLAQKLGILIPVKIEACDVPFGFQLDDTIDLIEWSGNPRSHELDPLIDDIERKVGRDAVPDRRALIEFESHWRRYGAQPLRAFGLGQPVEPDDGSLPSLRDKTPVGQRIHMSPPDANVRRRFKLWEKAEQRAEKRQAPVQFDGTEQRLMRSFEGHSSSVCAVTFSPDGQLALSAGGDRTLRLWEVETGKELRNITGHSDIVTSIAFSPEGCFAISGSYDNTLKLWEISTGKELRSITGHSDVVTSVAFSPDGRFALSGSADATLKLWDAAAGKELRTFAGHTDTVYSVAFSPDGRFALSGSADATLKLWDVAAGKELRTFAGHTDTVHSVAFSPDGHFVLSGSRDNTLRLWDVSTGTTLRSFVGHSNFVELVAFSPDGRFALSSSGDATLKLWDAAAGKELRTFAGHSDWVYSVAFSPDGRSALSGSEDRTLKLWDISEWTQAK